MEQAERLFTTTSPDGRDAIQEDTGHVRKLSDQVSEQLADSQAKVESQLQEVALFKSTLGQLRQWLSGLQDRLEGPLATERQTLPDRRTQLQSHRTFQQELAGGEHRLEQLRSRLPRRCSEQEQADTDKISDDFAELQERSRELLQRREAALRALQQCEEARETAATQLAGAKEKLSAAADGGSDRAASQLRVDKLRELLESLPDVEEAAADFAKATDEAAGLVGEDQAAQLRAEESALEDELASVANDAETRLRDAQEAADQLGDLERAVDELTRLLRTADGQSREREQQPSASDKRRLADKMAELLSGIDELEALADKLNDIASPVQGRDPRLDQAVVQANSRLPALRTHLTESASRWNRLADEHEELDKRLEDFTEFLSNAESDRSDIGRRPAATKDEVEAKLREIAELRSRLLSSGDDLRSLCEAAETVISGTAPTGREQIKSQVKGFKEDSDALDASLEDEEQRLQAYLGQLVSFTDAKETLLDWLDAAEARLADADAEAEEADTLEAKKRRASELRALLQEIQSQHRPLELALDKAQSLQAAAAATTVSSDVAVDGSELNGFIQETSRRYDALKSQAKARGPALSNSQEQQAADDDLAEMLTRAEEQAADLQQAETGLQSAADWVATMRDKLTPALAAPAGERPRLANRLERLQELQSLRDDGERRLQACADAVRKATEAAAPESLRQRLRSELESVEADFREYCRECETAKADVEERLNRLREAEALESTLEAWLVEQERVVREAAAPRATLEEKSAQLNGLQAVCESASDREAEFAQLEEAALEDLEASGSQSAINLLAKYQALQANSQQAAERCQAAIEEHQRLQARLADTEGEVAELEAEAAELEATCSVGELPERRRRVEALLAERKPTLQASLQELGAASAAAAASAGVGAAGHDQLRRETRRVKSSFDAVCERLVTLRRALEQRAAQADDIDGQLGRLADWIADARGRLEASAQPQDNLDARKQQLQACRALASELNSVAKQPAALNEQLESLATAGHVDTAPMSDRLNKLSDELDSLGTEVKAGLADCEEAVRELATYREARDEDTDWVASLADRVEFCAEFNGDRHALESRLERLKELAGGHSEAENRLAKLDELAEAARRRATREGAAAINSEVADLRQRWSQLAARAESLQSELRSRADAWADYEAAYRRCAAHIKTAESELKEAQELRATLEEKLTLAEQLANAAQVLDNSDTVGAEFADLAKQAAALASASRGESHVTGQANQLANRRAGLLEQLREVTSRLEDQAAQHRAFDAEVASFTNWLDDYEGRLAECQKAADRDAAQAALRTAGELLSEREEGFRRAQLVQDRLQPALAATAAPGREKLRSAAHSVQSRWDACASALGAARHRLEAALAQWMLYEEGAGQVERWSRELQEQLDRDSQEAAAAAPLADQWARLERLRGHQMAARSRQPAARSFAEKALTLAGGQAVANGEVAEVAPAGGAAQRLLDLADGYDRLASQLDERLREGERQLREARAFREALSEAQDWLTLAAERLGPTEETKSPQRAASPSSETALATDRSSLENGLASVRALLDQAPVGEQRLARAEERAGTSPAPDAARQETNRLRAAFDDLLVRCRAEAVRLQKAVDGWVAYDAAYAELKEWLSATEKRLQTEQLGASLDDKQKLADAQDRLSEEITAKLDEFRDLAQQSTRLLGEGGADLKVSTQLAKLLARYHGLAALARDHAQKLRSHAEDHAEFERNAGEAERWIADARERLASARQEPDDRYGLQRQRERLAELAMKREEGQVLVEAAAHWADKAERNTATQGREALRSQAQRVQAAWDSLVRELLETRATSEQRLQKWTELDDTVEKVTHWIKEREERLLTMSEPSQQQQDAALSTLHRLRELNQEVTAYEPVVQAAAERCRTMGRQEAGDQLPKSYSELRRCVQARLADTEAMAERRREFLQALQDQRAWLQRSRATLSGLQQEAKSAGDLAAVRRNLTQASALLSEAQGEAAEARMTRLRQLAAAAEATPEALECQEKVAGLRAQAAEICGSLERLAEQWEAFQTAYDALEAWLKEQQLPAAALQKQQQQPQTLGDTAEEKRQLAEQMQLRESQLRERQSEAEALAERARSLVELGADSRSTSGAAAQMVARVRSALDRSAERGRAAQAAAKQHSELDCALGELEQWMADCRERLSAATTDESPEQTEKSLAELQTELESGRARLRSTSELADRVLPATGASGAEQLRAALQRARREHEAAQLAVGDARANAEALSMARRDFQRQADQLGGWLADAEAKLATSAEAAASGAAQQQGLTERRAALERARVLQREAASQEAALRRLQERAAAAGGESRERATGLARRHEDLTSGLAQLAERLASSVTGQQEFQEAAERAATWLAQARSRLTQATGAPAESSAASTVSASSTAPPSRGDLDARAEQLANLRSDAAEAAEESDRLADEFRALVAEAEAAETRLAEASRQWRGFQEGWQRLADWLKDAEQKLRRGNEPAPNLDAKRRQAREFQKQPQQQQRKSVRFQVMSDEVHAKRPDLDKLQSLGTSLEQLTGNGQASARVAQLASKYQSLMTQCAEANERLHQISSDIKAYEEAYEGTRQWIDQATQRLLNSSGCHGDASKLAEKRRTVRNRLASVMEAGDRVLRTCDNPDSVRRQMDEMRADWSQLSKQVQQALTGLDKAATKLAEFGDLSGRLSGWLDDSERTLGQLTGSGQRFGEPTPEKREQYDRFKTEVAQERSRPDEGDFDELQQLSDDLQAIGKQPDLDRQCKDLRYRYNQLKRSVGLKVEELGRAQQEQQAYQDGLQDCEKWILQASFRLMEQSCGQVPSLDEAQRAADAHAAACREIEEQRKVLDSVVRMGRKLAEDNNGNAELRQEIDGQLKTLEENYANLKETAENIKNNLKDNLQKWKSYRDLLQSTDRWLHSDLAAWWAGRDPAVTKSAEDAERQTQETRAMQTRLSQARTEVTAAGFKCEPRGGVGAPVGAGAGDASGDPLSPHFSATSSAAPTAAGTTAAALSMSRLAEKVSRDLDANMERVERRLSQLETQRDAWERVSAEADDLADWLRDREAEAGALTDIFAIERLRDEVAAKSVSHELAEAKPQLKSARDALLRRLDGMAAQKRQAEALEEERRQRQMAKELEMEELRLRVSKARMTSAAPSGDGAGDGSPHWDQQTQTPCHQGTQTAKKQQAASAMDLTDSALFDRPVRDIELRNSGGGSGISRRLWPYHSTWDTSYKEDPIESLRRTLADMEARGISSAQQLRQPLRPQSAVPPPRASTPSLTRSDAFNDVLASARGESVRRSAPSPALSAGGGGRRAASATRRPPSRHRDR
uniref:Nesprin-1 n=1 Tax=Macrostomum lignano TaxID=282301 RepID=A0A1I8GQE7_9PLAT